LPAASDFGGAVFHEPDFGAFAGGAGQGFGAALALLDGEGLPDGAADGVVAGWAVVASPPRLPRIMTTTTTPTTATAARAAPTFIITRRLRAARRALSCRLSCHSW
jgi:hypothetical protein